MLTLKENKLFYDERDFDSLAADIGSPFFVISEKDLRARFTKLHEELLKFYGQVQIDYLTSSNNELSIQKSLAPSPINFEIRSMPEYFSVTKANVPSKRATMRMADLTTEDLEFAVREGIHTFYLHSMDNLKWLNDVSNKAMVVNNFVLEVDCFMKAQTGIISSDSLGVKLNEAVEFVKQSIELGNTQYIGLSMVSSEPVFSKDEYRHAVDVLTGVVVDLEKEGIETSEVCLQGDLPVESNVVADLDLIVDEGGNESVGYEPISDVVKFYAKKVEKFMKKPILVLRTNEFFISDAGILVAGVHKVEDMLAVLDITKDSLPDYKFRRGPRIVHHPVDDTNRTDRLQILIGKMHEESDIIVPDRSLPQMKSGDLLVFLSMGSISVSKERPGFDTDLPVYLINENGELKVVERENE